MILSDPISPRVAQRLAWEQQHDPEADIVDRAVETLLEDETRKHAGRCPNCGAHANGRTTCPVCGEQVRGQGR